MWSPMIIVVDADGGGIVPEYGPPTDLTREEAHAYILDRLARQAHLRPLYEVWKAGAKDNTVFAGPYVICIYPHGPGQAFAGAQAWVDGYLAAMREHGVFPRVDWRHPPTRSGTDA